MKQEIKERVEKIQKGEVLEGYKETKVGIIPNDWDVIEIGKMFEFKNGLNKEKSFFGHGRKIVNFTDVYNNRGIKVKDLKGLVNVNTSELKRYRVDKGDVFFTRTSETMHDIGMSSVVLESEDEAVFSGFVLRARPKNNMCTPVLSLNFKKYCFSTNKARKEIVIKSSYTTRALTSGTLLNKVLIAIPPESGEQKKIAKVLSTWDKAIELKEKLIEEKKEFKRGLVQKLLTGEMRFPEFTGEWEETRLGKKLTFIKKESIENPQNYRLLKVKLHLKGIEATENYPKSTENGRPYHLRCEGELLIGRQNFHNGGIGIIPKGMNGYITSNAISSLKSSDDNLMHYYYYLCNPNFYKKVGYLIGGTGQKEISESMFKNLKMTLPSNDEEIKKISGTIKTICQDLEMENNILSQLKEQKRGLMQLLLTGIVRVEVD